MIQDLPDSDINLCMELLKLPQMKTTHELIAFSEVFYAVWNAASCMSWNGNADIVRFI